MNEYDKNSVKILIVDDNDVNRILIRKIFEKTGYDFEIAGSGPDALEAFNSDFFTIVFMDIQMPAMDGYEVAGILREKFKSEARKPFIVALTANSLSGERERCLENGMNEYLAKPFSANDVRNMIDKSLNIN